MKNNIKLLTVFVAIFSFAIVTTYAQQGINYKAIISDNGAVLQNQAVQVQFSILYDGITLEYQETHSTTTDDNGIIILSIGEGTAVSGLYNSIHWDWVASHYLKVEIDTGSGYADFGTTEFKTVPYAIYAENGDGAKIINDLADAKKDVTSIFLGNEAGSVDDGNTDNTAIGNFALRYNTIGTSNNAIGFGALHVNTTGYSNIANGSNSLSSNTSGNENIALGAYTLTENITGSSNTALGKNAGYNSLGDNNIFLGYKAGYNEIGSNKLYIENTNSATPLIGGDFSTDEVTINGSIAIVDGTQGAGKILISDANGKASWVVPVTGATVLNDLTDAKSGGYSTFIGYGTGINDDGSSNDNTGIGYEALHTNTTGYNNVANGVYSLYRNTTGGENVANGHRSLRDNTTGSFNVAYGDQSLQGNTTGGSNTANGYHSLHNNITGSNNTAIGYQSGYNAIGVGNIFLGNSSGYNETGDNKLYIENTDSSTPLIGGDFNTDEVTINGTLNVTGNITGDVTGSVNGNITGDVIGNVTGNVLGKITGANSGVADMKAYIYGSIGPDGVNVTAISSDGFTASKIGTGSYNIDSASLNYYTVSTTMRYGAIGFITIEKFADYMLVRTYNTAGVAEDRGFDFIVFKK